MGRVTGQPVLFQVKKTGSDRVGLENSDSFCHVYLENEKGFMYPISIPQDQEPLTYARAGKVELFYEFFLL